MSDKPDDLVTCQACNGTGAIATKALCVDCPECLGNGTITRNSPSPVDSVEDAMAYDEALINQSIEKELHDSGNPMPPDLVVAMTIWGEARGESVEGKRMVAAVIRNRAAIMSRVTGYPVCLSVSDVCLKPHQFSCWSEGKFVQEDPDDDSPEWGECVAAANEILSDSYISPTTAANCYSDSSKSRPGWADRMEYLGKVGHHLFYFNASWRG